MNKIRTNWKDWGCLNTLLMAQCCVITPCEDELSLYYLIHWGLHTQQLKRTAVHCHLPWTFLVVTRVLSQQIKDKLQCSSRKILLTFPTRPAEGQSGVDLVFDLDESIEHHRPTSARENRVREAV